MRILTKEEICDCLKSPIFHTIGQAADLRGVECYLIGGYVRDLFLERDSKDIDVVVVGSGIEVAKKLSELLGDGAHLSEFRNFGTAQVKWHHQEIEFVGARRESYRRDSRKPIVEDGTLQDDLERRDFTINAMGICLNASRFGELIDPFYGIEDMQDRIIRTPLEPNRTFSDDPLRMMRCIRFATQLNFQIEDETFEALTENRERINIISKERIVSELNKIIASPVPSSGFVSLEMCGLLPYILPELSALNIKETRQGRSHKNIFYHTLEVLDNVARKSDNLYLRWAALLHDIGKPATKVFVPQTGWTFHNHNYVGSKMVKGIFRRLKLPMDDRMRYVEKLVELHMRPIAISDDIVTDSAVRRLLFDAGDHIDDLMTLCEADITSRNEEKKKRFRDNFLLVRQKLIDLEERDRIRNFQPPVDGEEIMSTFHLEPGAQVGAIKSAIKDAILDGRIPNDHDAAYEFMLHKAAEMGLEKKE